MKLKMSKKKVKYEGKREYLLSVGHKYIDVIEMLDILFLVDNKKQNVFTFSTNFESTQIEYNG